MEKIDTPRRVDGKTKISNTIDTRQFRILGARTDKKPTVCSAEVTRIHPSSVTVPSYTSYVGLDISVLAESNNKLLIHPPPFFPEHKEAQLSKELPGIYRTNFERRNSKLLYDHMAQQYRPDIDAFIKTLGIDEHDILRWIFERPLGPGDERGHLRVLLTNAKAWPLKTGPNSDYGNSKPAPKDLVDHVLPRLKPSPNTLTRAYAVLACVAIEDSIDQETEFDAWELFRRGPVMKDVLGEQGINVESSDSEASSPVTRRNQWMCRVCNL
jgi:hypothetical protein